MKKRIMFAAALLVFLFYQSFGFFVADDPAMNLSEQESLIRTPVDFETQVQPVLERRCVVCHGCYDAPCQLKLSSFTGLQRGASHQRIYDSLRIKSMEPSRLFTDAKSVREWRTREFFPVLNEQNQADASENLRQSVMYHLLRLKTQQPLPQTKKLPDDFTLELNRKQTCTTLADVQQFSREHPLWGMPYAMPGLPDEEYRTLVSWIAQGARAPAWKLPSEKVKPQILIWETFFNQKNLKQQLVSRYLFEHLFHAHIHFKGAPENEFYRLVRSTTAPGESVDEIATVRPNDSPGEQPFYYRLLRYQASIVNKSHTVYEFSEQRLERFHELFLKPDYDVHELPSYEPLLAVNPFRVFADIPAVSRYRFMLDDAHFFIEGFIKGPVCRGQIALNVIEDQFWVVFFNPDQPIITNETGFIDSMATELQLPADFDDNLDVVRIWTDYWKRQRRYMEAKQAWFKNIGTHKIDHAMEYIWDGDGHNPNAALTVFRHFDSASVAYGLVGDNPETAWVIDFPLLERIHYLLVADFNVFGSLGHRLSTRIYMDFLRMEGEDSFLAFLPTSRRREIRDKWYQGQRIAIKKLFDAPQEWLKTESVSGYETNDPQREFYHRLHARLLHLNDDEQSLNTCGQRQCQPTGRENLLNRANRAMARIAQLRGKQLHAFPDVAFVRVQTGQTGNDLVYTLIRNKAYKNVTSFFADERERNRADLESDTLTVVNWLEGAYPNFFFSVDLEDIDRFARACAEIHDTADYERFVDQYGIRRTNPLFWEFSDWFQNRFRQTGGVTSGIFDLSRYNNL